MTATKLDPALCRVIAGMVTDDAQHAAQRHGSAIAAQLTAAADLAERWPAMEQAAEHWHREDGKLGEMHNALLARPTLTEERVREVVRPAAMTGVCEAIGRMMGPTYWHDNPTSHGMFERVADAIADRAAKELAGAVVSSPVQTVGIGPDDAIIIDAALGFWTSDDNDAPHADIARIRALLASPGGGS